MGRVEGRELVVDVAVVDEVEAVDMGLRRLQMTVADGGSQI